MEKIEIVVKEWTLQQEAIAQLKAKLANEMNYHRRKTILNKIAEAEKVSKKTSVEQPKLF